ncbi:Hpt domain-containing protein/2OG-FeII_Oxy_3 domain-containing protein [Cephalotus follicularis]|uniref:procollagen-proline 4-dioxygenase n=1 Tax=Cephalotus follicularis TaxID=3775 RepID=A0A1Q3B5T1_CEPFO|nr:Hpt domain-containing protein/2OG-FeII_Oxy_3 domain-containing protein [Cephalotus follicularis]
MPHNLTKKKTFSGKISVSLSLSKMNTKIFPLQFLYFLWISIIIQQCWSSFVSSPSSVIDPSKVKQISTKPRAYVYEGFLTGLECDHLISLAKSELKRSAVADNLSGKSKLSEVRTSSGMFIPKGKDPIVVGIEDKISTWTFLPKENGEDIQVLRYEPGQKYEPHFDYFVDKVNIARGGHRVATVLLYLTDVAKGGETVFPSAEVSTRRKVSATNSDLSECGRKGVAVKPRRGDALLFFSLHPNALPDQSSLHAGCPVIEGEKWSATKWIHVDSFDKNLTAGGNCTDSNESCEKWAALGECTKNREYMVGSPELPGYCRRSCKMREFKPQQHLLKWTLCVSVSKRIEKERERGRIQRQHKGMEVGQMQRRLLDYTKTLFMEGFLDGQFLQLQQLQDESNPGFVVEVVSLFFDDSERLLNDLTWALDQPSVDFGRVDSHVHQLKGSSSSIAAQRIKNASLAFRNFCEEQNVEACHRCLQQIKQEYYLARNNLETLFRLEQQIVAAGGSNSHAGNGFLMILNCRKESA